MKSMISVFLLFTLLFTQSLFAQSWWAVGSAGFTNSEASYTSLAINNNGIPYLAFQDEFQGKVSVMKFDGMNWNYVGNSKFSGGTAINLSLAIDGNGKPYVLFQDWAESKKANVMTYNGSSWELVGDAGISSGEADYTSLAIAEDGTPYVAFQDAGESYKLVVKKYEEPYWKTLGDPYNTSDGEADYISIAVYNNIPYVAYTDGYQGQITVKRFVNNSDWEVVGSAKFTDGASYYNSLAIKDGVLYVAYMDGAHNNRASVMKYDGNWSTVGSVGFSDSTAVYTSIAIDNSGSPYIVYEDFSDQSRATVKKFDGSNWVTVGVGATSAGQAQFTQIAISPNGTPVIAYKDIANGNKATVSKYSLLYEDQLPVELTTFTATTNGNHVVLNWTTATETNNSGWQIERSTGNQWQNIGFVSGKGTTTTAESYSFTDNNQTGKVQYRLKQIDNDGHYTYSNVLTVDLAPLSFELNQNYPNPFNPTTVIRYQISEVSNVKLVVMDLLGREIKTLVNEKKTAGVHQVDFDATHLPSGVYFYKLTTENFSQTKKMMLVK